MNGSDTYDNENVIYHCELLVILPLSPSGCGGQMKSILEPDFIASLVCPPVMPCTLQYAPPPIITIKDKQYSNFTNYYNIENKFGTRESFNQTLDIDSHNELCLIPKKMEQIFPGASRLGRLLFLSPILFQVSLLLSSPA